MTILTSPKQTIPAWRWLSLSIWLFFALAYLAFFLLEQRLDFLQIQVPCQGEGCNWLAISQAEVDVLESLGLSTLVYAALTSAASVLSVIIYWLLGGLILWRQGTSRIGLAVSLVLLVIPVTMITDPDNLYASYPGLLLPSILLSTLGGIFVTLFFYLFPNGRFYPRWASLLLAAAILSILIAGYQEMQGVTPLSSGLFLWDLAMLALLALAMVFQIFRYMRDSNPVERQQTKWTLLGIVCLALAIPLWLITFGGFVEIPAGAPRLLASLGGWLFLMLLAVALPITLAIAILRYRLWDIDLIIRRTLVYSALTAALALVYFGSVLLLQNLVQGFSGQEQSPLVIVVSTLLIAALFNPLRRRLQNTVDRRFYRSRYDAARTLEAFAAGLRQEVDLDAISEHLLAAAAESMQPAHASLWLKPGTGEIKTRP